jgi:hypothetical protein
MGLSGLAGLLKGAAPIARGAASIANKGLTAKGTLGGTLGALFAAEAVKQGAIMPVLKATGIARTAPAAAPVKPPPGGPQPLTMQELIMYGSPGKKGLFGSSHPLLGGEAAQTGLIERRFDADNQFRNAQLNAALESQRISSGSDVERQRLISAANTILGGQQAKRDMYSAQQNTLSNMSANMSAMVSGVGINVPTSYGQAMVQQTQGIAPLSTGGQSAFGSRSLSGGYPRRGYGRRNQMGAMGAMGTVSRYGGYGGMM